MTNPERPINTNLEVNILRHGKTLAERLNDKSLEIRDFKPEVAAWLRTQPRLFRDDKRIKCPEGRIFMDYYSDPRGNQIPDSEEIDENTKVVMRHWGGVDTLPEAMNWATKASGGIKEDIGKLREVTGFLSSTIRRFQNGAVGMEDEQDLQMAAARIMVGAGYDNAIKPEKLQVKNRTLKAAKLTDSTGRLNTQQARMQFVYAFYDTLPLSIFYPRAEDKWESRVFRLSRLYEQENFFLNEGKHYLEDLGNTSMRSQEYGHKAHALKEFAQNYLTDENFKTNPNRLAALYTRVAVVGPMTGREREELLGYKVDEEEADYLFSFDETLDNIAGRDRYRLIEMSLSKIAEAKRIGDEILFPPDQERPITLYGKRS